MHFPISGVVIDPILLVALGFVVGILGGFFGVGGSFLAGPALFALGMPMNFVVGTDLTHIVGKSIVAARKHWSLGGIDFRLALIMMVGTVLGIQVGVAGIDALKVRGDVNLVVGVIAIVVYTAHLALRRLRKLEEHPHTARRQEGRLVCTRPRARTSSSSPAFAKWVQQLPLGPRIALPFSGIKSISVAAILLVSFVGGVFSSFLGGGAGYIRMPSMVYLLGIPTHIAVGTDLFEIVVSASIGSYEHALKGNVDVLVALIMQTGAAVGAQIGATLTQYFSGPRLRLAFAPLPLIGAGLIVYGLLHGQQVK